VKKEHEKSLTDCWNDYLTKRNKVDFNRVYYAMADRLFYKANWLLKRSQLHIEAKDLVSEVFTNAMKSSKSIDNIEAYLMRALNNCFISHQRKQKRESEYKKDLEQRQKDVFAEIKSIDIEPKTDQEDRFYKLLEKCLGKSQMEFLRHFYEKKYAERHTKNYTYDFLLEMYPDAPSRNSLQQKKRRYMNKLNDCIKKHKNAE